MSRQVIKEYAEARAMMGIPNEQGIEDYMALKQDVNELLQAVAELQTCCTDLHNQIDALDVRVTALETP